MHLAYMHWCVCIGVYAIETTPSRLLDYIDPFFYPFWSVLFDISFLLLFFYFLSFFSIKISLNVLYWISFVWSIVNVVYCRFFNDYISFSIIPEIRNLVGLDICSYLETIISSTDIVYLISFLCYFILNRIRCIELLKPWKYIVILYSCCIIFYFLPYYSQSYLDKIRGYSSPQISSVKGFLFWTSVNHPFYVCRYGVVRGQILYELLSNDSKLQLTEKEQSLVDNFIDNKTKNYSKNSICKKKCVFVLVESLLSAVVDLSVNEIEVTPTLNALKTLDNCYYNSKMKSNVENGESSDGQFIYMTGLLPLKQGVTVNVIRNRRVFGIPSIWKNNREENNAHIFVPTPPYIWHQEEMNHKYGFDKMHSSINMTADSNVSDSILFEYASNMLIDNVGANQDSFDMLLTISMHSPYKENFQSRSDNEFVTDYYSPEYSVYLNKCHYMDAQLGRFIEKYKSTGFFDDTVFIIVSDHQAHKDLLKTTNEIINDEYLPCFIINADIDIDTCYYGEINQLDLYPTILDIKGCDSEWRGLGSTFLTSEYQKYSIGEASIISRLIILSDYLTKYDLISQ